MRTALAGAHHVSAAIELLHLSRNFGSIRSQPFWQGWQGRRGLQHGHLGVLQHHGLLCCVSTTAGWQRQLLQGLRRHVRRSCQVHGADSVASRRPRTPQNWQPRWWFRLRMLRRSCNAGANLS
jgi:hypothetical protein